ncbi:related to Maleamate amidohydrolase [Ramularia collo-cygni]|uniref:Related to Maleamate amidohydrolase n=1 Tax=Ramularia collo-cygni TaxID=112498 RepID=A0A2D3UQQ7_9PEZI|nr:related to Maleamate amidohydrolase [Ramularia collo-cygni]CZT15655.1 related to Maleamate amidohydrolase [Ramularia collo-cygni]
MTAPTSHAEAASYRASGFANRLGWGQKPALLLIDVCKAYFHPTSPLSLLSNPAASASPDVMRNLLSAARSSPDNIPIIWTKVAYGDMAEAGIFYHKAKVLEVFHHDDPRGLGDWIEGLEPREGETVVTKKYPSAFFGTDLEKMLREEGVDSVVVCGVSTSGCVRASVLDALCYGFRPMVVETACGDRSPEIHNANVFDMDSKMADVVTEEEAVERLRAGLVAG